MAQRAAHHNIDRGLVEQGLQLKASGMSIRAIAKELGVGRGKVERWISTGVDPHLDEVALTRARKGDHDVFHNLTSFEMREFLDRLKAEVDAMDLHDRNELVQSLGKAFGVSVSDLLNRRDRRRD